MMTDYSTNNNDNTSSTSPNTTTTISTATTSPTSTSSISSTRYTKNISTTTNLDYASSSFDEGEESDSYDIRKFDLKYSNNNHRWSVSSSSSNSTTNGFNYPSHKGFETRGDIRNNYSNSSNINNSSSNNNNNLLLSKSIHNSSRIRGGRKWETDDELYKTNYNRHSLPIQSSHIHHHHPSTNTNASSSSSSATLNTNNNKNNNNNNNIDETNTTKSLLYLLNKEREKRRELQSAYDQTLQRLQDLEKTHSGDINALESDIQTLKKALVKESKGRTQLNKLFNEAREKFGEEMQIWATKVIVMENQGNEMQETFKETISQLEKGEIEISRLRKENQMLRDQLLNNNNNNINNNNNSNNIQDFMQIINNNSSNSIEEPDEISKESKNTNDPIESSDAESVVTCSKITKLNNRIIELENELSIAKKDKLELESDKQITIKQLEEKQEKQATLLRANIAQKQKIIDDLNQELRKVRYSEGKREEKQKLLLRQNSINLVKEEKEKQDVVENSESSNNNNNNVNNNSINNRTNQSKLPKPRGSSTIPIISYSSSKDRKTSLTNSDSIEAVSSKKSPNIKKDKKDKMEDVEYVEAEIEGEQSELFSEEEEEEERDDKSSLCTGSENWAQSRIGSEENSSLQDPNNELGEDDNHSNSNSNNSNSSSNNDKNNTIIVSTVRNRKFNNIVEDEDDMLDAILSDREDRMLPLIGHYSAAEFTEDEDYVLDNSVIGGNNNDDDLFDRSISRRHSLASKFSGGSGGGRNAKLKFK